MIGLWGAPYERPRQGDAPRSTPTYYPGGCRYVCCQFTSPRWAVTHFYQKLRVCSCGTKPQHCRNHQCPQLRDDIIMRTQCHHDIIMITPRIMGKPRFSCSRALRTPLTKYPLFELGIKHCHQIY